ncbi:MAG: redoxin domain-containing protein [Chloracidobacterium sp.]|nr:redoxin domain-containing protein [Chloracidobacterium sp.]
MADWLGIGDKARDFCLATDNGDEWCLSHHSGSVVVLLFYPQNETLVCTRQLCSVRDNWLSYLETKATIVGISPGTPNEHQEFSRNLSLPLPLLADPDREITRIYARHAIFPVSWTRAVVVIDAKGIIRNRNVMLRAFRPADSQIITDIYAARGDELNDRYDVLKERIRSIGQQA